MVKNIGSNYGNLNVTNKAITNAVKGANNPIVQQAAASVNSNVDEYGPLKRKRDEERKNKKKPPTKVLKRQAELQVDTSVNMMSIIGQSDLDELPEYDKQLIAAREGNTLLEEGIHLPS